MKVVKDKAKIEEVLKKGVAKIYPSLSALKKEMLSGKRLRLYCGYDPSSPFLHLGHLITLKKLAQFQSLGHEVIMLIGDFTGMIGDPTGKISARKKLTREEVLKNANNYKNQISKILRFEGPNKAKILYNSQWSDSLSFADLIELASNFTVQQMIVRDMFQERIKQEKPIYLHEFLYPLAQAYDSVAMDVDLEVGGDDQIFNMLCGRHLMKALKKKEKFVLATKLLTDPTGKKMGKTEGNVVNLTDSPSEIYGKIMSWTDGLIIPGFELCTSLDLKEISLIARGIKKGKLNPREAKARLAREIIGLLYSKKEALLAEKEFERVFKEKKLPQSIPQYTIKKKKINILELLVETELASSKSEAKRLVLQGGVRINEQKESDWQKVIEPKKGLVIQAGKRKFAQIK